MDIPSHSSFSDLTLFRAVILILLVSALVGATVATIGRAVRRRRRGLVPASQRRPGRKEELRLIVPH